MATINFKYIIFMLKKYYKQIISLIFSRSPIGALIRIILTGEVSLEFAKNLDKSGKVVVDNSKKLYGELAGLLSMQIVQKAFMPGWEKETQQYFKPSTSINNPVNVKVNTPIIPVPPANTPVNAVAPPSQGSSSAVIPAAVAPKTENKNVETNAKPIAYGDIATQVNNIKKTAGMIKEHINYYSSKRAGLGVPNLLLIMPYYEGYDKDIDMLYAACNAYLSVQSNDAIRKLREISTKISEALANRLTEAENIYNNFHASLAEVEGGLSWGIKWLGDRSEEHTSE